MVASVLGSLAAGAGSALVGSLLGGGGGGSNPSQTQISEYLIPDELKGDYEGLMTASRGLFAKPFQEYTDPRIAGFTPDQMTAFQGIRDMQGKYQPLMDTASQLALQSATQYQNGITPEQIQQFMNPYQQNVIDISKRETIRDFDKQYNNLRGKQASSGAFGGTRGSLMEAELYRNTGQQLDDMQYRGMADSYTQALSAAFKNREGLASSSRNLMDIAGAGQGLGLKDLTALGAAGEAQQANQQQQYDFDFSEFGRELAYEPERINQFNSFLQGWLPRKGMMTKDPGSPSGLAQGLGMASIFQGMNGGNGGGGGIFGQLFSGLGNIGNIGGFGAGWNMGSTTPNITPWNPSMGLGGAFPYKDGGLVPGYEGGGFVKGMEDRYGKDVFGIFAGDHSGRTISERMKDINYDDGLYNEPLGKGVKLFEPGKMSPLERMIAMPFQKLGKAYDEFTGIGPALTEGTTKMFRNAGEIGSSYARGLRDLTTKRTDFEQQFYDAEPPMTKEQQTGLPPPSEMAKNMAETPDQGISSTVEGSIESDEVGSSSEMFAEDAETTAAVSEDVKQNNRALIQLGIGLLSTPGKFNFGLAKGMERYVEQLDKGDEIEMKKEAYAEAKRQNAIENQMNMKRLDFQMLDLAATIENNKMGKAVDLYKARKDASEKRRDDMTKIDDILVKAKNAEIDDGHPIVYNAKNRQIELQAAELDDKVKKGEIDVEAALQIKAQLKAEALAAKKAAEAYAKMMTKEAD